MVTLRSSKRKHIDVCIEEEVSDGEITSKYFKKDAPFEVETAEEESYVLPVESEPANIEWIKSLNSEQYFTWVSEVTDDNPERWNKPLDPKIFKNRPVGAPPFPKSFVEIYSRVRLMRSKIITPVDSVGCAALPITVSAKCDIQQNEIKPKNYRLQLLVSLMMSAQTRDESNAKAMLNLIKYSIEEIGIPEGLNLEALLRIEEDVLVNLIKPVGFFNRKAHYIKQTVQLLIDEFESDIPTDIAGMLSLPGVGPKMGLLALQKAWGKMDGIGVDVHVHRLCNMWHWVDPKKCKTAEHTRKELESWLPKELWYEINPLLVGFGQVICMARGKRCDLCLANDVCNAVDKKIANKGIMRSASKRRIQSPTKRGDFTLWLRHLEDENDALKVVDSKKERPAPVNIKNEES